MQPGSLNNMPPIMGNAPKKGFDPIRNFDFSTEQITELNNGNEVVIGIDINPVFVGKSDVDFNDADFIGKSIESYDGNKYKIIGVKRAVKGDRFVTLVLKGK